MTNWASVTTASMPGNTAVYRYTAPCCNAVPETNAGVPLKLIKVCALAAVLNANEAIRYTKAVTTRMRVRLDALKVVKNNGEKNCIDHLKIALIHQCNQRGFAAVSVRVPTWINQSRAP